MTDLMNLQHSINHVVCNTFKSLNADIMIDGSAVSIKIVNGFFCGSYSLNDGTIMSVICQVHFMHMVVNFI